MWTMGFTSVPALGCQVVLEFGDVVIRGRISWDAQAHHSAKAIFLDICVYTYTLIDRQIHMYVCIDR